MEESRSALYQKCRQKLLKVRQDRINGLKALEGSLSETASGDEGDMARTFESQHTAIAQREKLLMELKEVDQALERIEGGTYGVCEETEEPIEADRLMAIPWTRLSIEGAETRERIRKKFA
jgi:DnaK suppressor protein